MEAVGAWVEVEEGSVVGVEFRIVGEEVALVTGSFGEVF